MLLKWMYFRPTLVLILAGSGASGMVPTSSAQSPRLVPGIPGMKVENSPRAIIGTQQPNQVVQQSLDLVKLLEQQQQQQRMQQQQQQQAQQQQAQQQRQASLSPASPNLQRTAAANFGVTIPGRVVPSPTPMVRPGVGMSPAANALLMQRMMPNIQPHNQPRSAGQSSVYLRNEIFPQIHRFPAFSWPNPSFLR